MNGSWLEIIPVMLIGVMAFPLFWGGVLIPISYLSGWQSLASIYASEEPPERETRKFRSLSTRRGKLPSNYGGIITIGVSETYLYVSVMFLFRIGHKPLRIPFSDISIQKHLGLFKRDAYLTVSRIPGLTLIISMRDIEWIEAAYNEML